MRVALATLVAGIATCVFVGSGLAHDATQARTSTWCAGSQSWTSVRRHLGDPVRVKARIASVAYARSSSGRPTFLNLGHAYPSSGRVTVVIWGEDRGNFPRAPERMFRRGMTICVQGIATQYRGVPQIEVALWDPKGRLLSF
jgi:DNA/RNA endonuclease YhcR with UshA esterase domain